MPITLYTIGHSNHTLEHFVGLLNEHGIEILADVRSKPYSRFCPQFSRDTLRTGVEAKRIEYRFLGRTLGGKPDDERMYDADGRPLYERIAQQPEFRRGIDDLLAIAGGQRVAIMCSEEDPSSCHRRYVIAPALLARGVVILHIRGDSRIETEEALLEQEYKSDNDQLSLFGGETDN